MEPGRLSGWLARQLALLGSVVPYALAADLAAPLLGVRTHAMMVWRAVQRLGVAAQAYTDALSTHHAAAPADEDDARQIRGAKDSAAHGLTVTYWCVLKQPDKQEKARRVFTDIPRPRK